MPIIAQKYVGSSVSNVQRIKSVAMAIAEDITDFPLFVADSHFTDDSVLTIAVADCLLSKKDYTKTFREYARRYPNAGYGGSL